MLKRVLRLRDLSLCKLSRHNTRKFLFWVWKKFWKERTVRRFRLGPTALPVAGTTCFYLKEEEWSGVNRTSYACCKLYFFFPPNSLCCARWPAARYLRPQHTHAREKLETSWEPFFGSTPTIQFLSLISFLYTLCKSQPSILSIDHSGAGCVFLLNFLFLFCSPKM